MKRNKLNISIITFIIILVAFVVGIIIANIILQEPEDWKIIMSGLLNDLLSVSVVGVVATVFSKIISDNFFKIKKNNDKLMSFGVNKIGGGKSSTEDIINLFGNKKKDNYPEVIKLLFITGNGFFATFEKDISECLKNSNCIIKILLMSTEDDNKAYIERCEAMCPQNKPYANQLKDETLVILNRLNQKFPNRIEVRYFKDEYRYNFRIVQYRKKDGSYNNICWLNIQPFNKDAVDLSVGLTGSWDDSTKNLEENIFYQLDKGFDFIWNKYDKVS